MLLIELIKQLKYFTKLFKSSQQFIKRFNKTVLLLILIQKITTSSKLLAPRTISGDDYKVDIIGDSRTYKTIENSA